MEKEKLYCVHVIEQYEFEGVKTKTPQEAEDIIVRTQYANNYDNIREVVVMRQCECGYDNDNTNKTCDECGAKL